MSRSRGKIKTKTATRVCEGCERAEEREDGFAEVREQRAGSNFGGEVFVGPCGFVGEAPRTLRIGGGGSSRSSSAAVDFSDGALAKDRELEPSSPCAGIPKKCCPAFHWMEARSTVQQISGSSPNSFGPWSDRLTANTNAGLA